MSHIVRLLNQLRERPGMYIGAPLLSRLAFFLRGYDMGAEQVGAAPPDPFLYEFREWIYRRFGLVNRSWEDLIIADAGGGDREGFVRFWQLYDEYMAASKNGAPVVEQQHNGSPRVEQKSRP